MAPSINSLQIFSDLNSKLLGKTSYRSNPDSLHFLNPVNNRVIQRQWLPYWRNFSDLTTARHDDSVLLASLIKKLRLKYKGNPMCAAGSSAGSMELVEAMAHFSAGNSLQHVLLTAGPSMTRIDLSCSADAQAVDTCEELHSAYSLSSNFIRCGTRTEFSKLASIIGNEVAKTCFKEEHSQEDLNKLRYWSNIRPKGKFDYPNLTIDIIVGSQAPSIIGAKIYFDKVNPIQKDFLVIKEVGHNLFESIQIDQNGQRRARSTNIALDKLVESITKSCVANPTISPDNSELMFPDLGEII